MYTSSTLGKLYACLWLFQVWSLSKDEPGDWYPGLAITMGDCDWLVFLLLWGGASEPHRRPPAVAGHRSGRHYPILTGQCQQDLYFPYVTVHYVQDMLLQPSFTQTQSDFDYLVLNGSLHFFLNLMPLDLDKLVTSV